mmetsp:Transcript_42042/g.42913  ORF Transcript_42042/g.42913 Transcript_42042/m.42913 type:complete len:95 (-) Transcript_42042:302-586(-)
MHAILSKRKDPTPGQATSRRKLLRQHRNCILSEEPVRLRRRRPPAPGLGPGIQAAGTATRRTTHLGFLSLFQVRGPSGGPAGPSGGDPVQAVGL